MEGRLAWTEEEREECGVRRDESTRERGKSQAPAPGRFRTERRPRSALMPLAPHFRFHVCRSAKSPASSRPSWNAHRLSPTRVCSTYPPRTSGQRYAAGVVLRQQSAHVRRLRGRKSDDTQSTRYALLSPTQIALTPPGISPRPLSHSKRCARHATRMHARCGYVHGIVCIVSRTCGSSAVGTDSHMPTATLSAA